MISYFLYVPHVPASAFYVLVTCSTILLILLLSFMFITTLSEGEWISSLVIAAIAVILATFLNFFWDSYTEKEIPYTKETCELISENTMYKIYKNVKNDETFSEKIQNGKYYPKTVDCYRVLRTK